MTIAIFLLVLFATMTVGVPIAFALMLTALALMVHLDFFDAQLLAQNVQAGFDSFPLLAVPFFILAGELMNAGGLSRRIIELARSLVGHIQGGLGYVAIAASLMLASMSGSAIADTAALATLLLADDAQAELPRRIERRPDRLGRHHRADRATVHADGDLWRDHQHLDQQAVHGRHRARHPDGHRAGAGLARHRGRNKGCRWRRRPAGPSAAGAAAAAPGR
jgi:hypothetical protein